MRAKVPVSVVHRAENSPSEPLITVAQLMALMKALWAASASFSPANPDVLLDQ
ncbi:hypothetical protein [Methylobacterium sp. J-070]|uniref:hypothetical protein n=1 Tax=Methylobacterium sp. J-070 TaxID=2836650 RepID=UPI001FBB47D8|nr:hypothetical protein [Methylobacterium sp. J-070]MCJ2050484.1 hypothetical protein [Methylobacterium sp. J-070]